MFLVFHFLHSNVPDNKCHKCQTSGTCAGVCMCDLTHQMEKTGLILDTFCVQYPHVMAFLNFSGHFLTLKTLDLHAV